LKISRDFIEAWVSFKWCIFSGKMYGKGTTFSVIIKQCMNT